MPVSVEFQSALKKAVGKLSQGDIVDRTGISQTYVNNMLLRGRIPRQETLSKLCEGLRLGARDRARLFAAAGYSKEAAWFEESPPHVPWPSAVVETADLLCKLSERQLAVVRNVAEMMLEDRVIHALAPA
jgi:transcriptional regulator with XRE-family HTH domain